MGLKVLLDKPTYYRIIKGKIQQKNVAIMNLYAPNNTASKPIIKNLTELKGETVQSTSIIENFNTSLPATNRSRRKTTLTKIKNIWTGK